MNEWTDQEINGLAEWLQDLSIDQLFFLMHTYDAFLKQAAQDYTGTVNVH